MGKFIMLAIRLAAKLILTISVLCFAIFPTLDELNTEAIEKKLIVHSQHKVNDNIETKKVFLHNYLHVKNILHRYHKRLSFLDTTCTHFLLLNSFSSTILLL